MVYSSPDDFPPRHLGDDSAATAEMLRAVGFDSVEALADAAVPAAIRDGRPLNLPAALPERAALAALRELAERNQVFRSFIGLGYHDTFTPPVIQRAIFENPGWYTAYTPYQAEISQGRLEALLNFQTVVCELTGLGIANASMLDEGTAAAEAMMMAHRLQPGEGVREFFVSEACHPQTIEIVRTRATPLGVTVTVGDHRAFQPGSGCFGVLVQYPDTTGSVHDYEGFFGAAHAAGALCVVAADPLALTLLRAPGEFGADMAVGSAQRFGVPLGYGGPHAGYLATKDEFKRQMPGRLVGVSKDAQGNPAMRLALGTREQHIRRDKATSNICTAQVLLAVMASMYAVYHGPEGLRNIARKVKRQTERLAAAARQAGLNVNEEPIFDTVTIRGVKADAVLGAARDRGINLRPVDASTIAVTFDETVSDEEVAVVSDLIADGNARAAGAMAPSPRSAPRERDAHGASDAVKSRPAAGDSRSQNHPGLIGSAGILESGRGPEAPMAEFRALHRRTSSFLDHPVFHRHRTEHEMLRYIKRLEAKDLSLCHSMISLGSCTMKLNAASEMLPVTWPEFSKLHPFAPAAQAQGYARLFADLEAWLGEITGLPGVSLQPNAGSQGEYAGLLAIRAYHESRGEGKRNVCLIPTSAHGTNPASAAMGGFKVVAVACDERGNIELGDLRAKAADHRTDLAALMVTYPSTHGVFEAGIRDICAVIHEHGGQVYMDGANMNAQVGLTSPGRIGADVCHLNLHKTFCIPHGGGGPGMGPIAVAKHLAPFLPGKGVGPVSAAPWGSASILVISWMYIRMMGPEGLVAATRAAILNANYVAQRLEPGFPVLYRGNTGLVAHECIVDVRGWKKHGIEVEDVAKRLIDYGYHAPTMSFPVPGTLMIEPTESETKAELDRFCDAMLSIHDEMREVAAGKADAANNVLKQAPHTAQVVCSDRWDRPYSRERAAFPTPFVRAAKFWPAVGRVDNVYGDRNLVCSCVGMEAYAETTGT